MSEEKIVEQEVDNQTEAVSAEDAAAEPVKEQKHKKHAKADKHKRDSKSRSSKKKSSKEQKTEAVPQVDESYLRLQADFNNYRKRVLREKEDLYQRANEDIMEELLPVMDHLELALAAAGDKKDDPFVEGFRLVGEQLKGALAKFGLSEVDTDGCEFDPNLHEAIMHMPTDAVEDNHIVSVARKGYRLGERLLRAAQVVVSSGSPESVAADAEEQQ
jgi:molecular chaperone GrpE